VLQPVVNAFFFVEWLPDDGLERPKHVGGLAHAIFVSNYSTDGSSFVYGELSHCTERGLFSITHAVCHVQVRRLFFSFSDVVTAV